MTSTEPRRRLHEHWAAALPTVEALLLDAQTTDVEREGVRLFIDEAHRWITVEPEVDRRRGRIDWRSLRLVSWLHVPDLGRFRLCAPLGRHCVDEDGKPLDLADTVRNLRAQHEGAPDHVPTEWCTDDDRGGAGT